MKIWTLALASVIVIALSVDVATAQPPRRPGEGPGARREGERPEHPQAGRPRGPGPIFQALDADANGEISAEEIKNAAAALKKLDKNGDGKLTHDELRPQFRGPGGPEAGPGRRPGGPGGDDRPQRPRRPGNRGGPGGDGDRPQRPARPAPPAEE